MSKSVISVVPADGLSRASADAVLTKSMCRIYTAPVPHQTEFGQLEICGTEIAAI